MSASNRSYGETERRAFTGWRAELGIPELALIIRNVRRTRNPRHVAADLVALDWPEDEAMELANIASRLSELVLAPKRRTA